MDLGIDGLLGATQIGAGGTATIYRARQKALERDVAVKVLKASDPQLVRRLEREARTLGRLSRHPGIVTIYDTGVTEAGQPYLLLELCASSLLDRLNTEKRIDPIRASRFVGRVAAAVADAHSEGVVHRDLKPGNILVSEDGQPLVSDFGISRVLDSSFGETTSVGFTPGYVAPETLRGESAERPADVYALGATLYHMVSGRPPYIERREDSSNLLVLASRIANDPVPDLRTRGVPDRVCRAIEWAMAKNPVVRPTARRLQMHLDMLGRGEDPSDSVPSASVLSAPPSGGPAFPPLDPTDWAEDDPETTSDLAEPPGPEVPGVVIVTDTPRSLPADGGSIGGGSWEVVKAEGSDPGASAEDDGAEDDALDKDSADGDRVDNDGAFNDVESADGDGSADLEDAVAGSENTDRTLSDDAVPDLELSGVDVASPFGAGPSTEVLAERVPVGSKSRGPVVMIGAAALLAAALVVGLGAWLVASDPGRGSDQAGSDQAVTESDPASPSTADGDGSTTGGIGVPNRSPGDGVRVVPARANWEAGYFQSEVVAALLSELGYDLVDPAANEMSPDAVYVPMAAGEVSYWAHGWYPGHADIQVRVLGDADAVEAQLAVFGDMVPLGGLEGLVVSSDVVETNEVRSLDQINDDPDLVALFDVDDDGLAEVFGCQRRFRCHAVIDDMIDFNQWTNLEQVEGRPAELIGRNLIRLQDGVPFIQYLWTPSAFSGHIGLGDDVTWLSLGSAENVLDGSTPSQVDSRLDGPVDLGSGCTEDPCHLGWGSADVRITANRDFVEANPSARQLFEQIRIPAVDVGRVNAELSGGPAADRYSDTRVKAAAMRWISENQALVDQWLAQARGGT